ncbi:MAG: hypothetical protein R2861_02805 [Desulfobacterales bacterium]
MEPMAGPGVSLIKDLVVDRGLFIGNYHCRRVCVRECGRRTGCQCHFPISKEISGKSI